MDNNNNVSGIPNVSDIKFDDTPAESFNNLYGESNQQSVGQPNVAPNPGMTPNMAQPNVAPNPGMTPNMAQPNVAPNPGMTPNMVQPNVAPNPGMAPNIAQPNVAPNPGMASNMVQPNVAPNLGMTPNMAQPNVAPNPGMAPNIAQPSGVPNVWMTPNMAQPNVAPNPGTIIQPQVDNLSNIDIDAEKMQSIEEQLSKTSQYNPADFQQEQISIPTDNQSEKNKSGLAFVIVLFVILALVIAFLPQITKLIK